MFKLTRQCENKCLAVRASQKLHPYMFRSQRKVSVFSREEDNASGMFFVTLLGTGYKHVLIWSKSLEILRTNWQTLWGSLTVLPSKLEQHKEVVQSHGISICLLLQRIYSLQELMEYLKKVDHILDHELGFNKFCGTNISGTQHIYFFKLKSHDKMIMKNSHFKI